MKKRNLIIMAFVSVLSVVFIVVMVNSSKNRKINTVSSTPTPDSNRSGLPDDKAFNETADIINQQYPWYSELPIDNDDYHIVYDFTEEKFRIRLKKLLNENQMQIVINNAVTDIKNIGAKEPVNYYVFDSEGNRI